MHRGGLLGSAWSLLSDSHPVSHTGLRTTAWYRSSSSPVVCISTLASADLKTNPRPAPPKTPPASAATPAMTTAAAEAHMQCGLQAGDVQLESFAGGEARASRQGRGCAGGRLLGPPPESRVVNALLELLRLLGEVLHCGQRPGVVTCPGCRHLSAWLCMPDTGLVIAPIQQAYWQSC